MRELSEKNSQTVSRNGSPMSRDNRKQNMQIVLSKQPYSKKRKIMNGSQEVINNLRVRHYSLQAQIPDTERRPGNIAQVRDVLNIQSKASSASSHANLDWMMMLRKRMSIEKPTIATPVRKEKVDLYLDSQSSRSKKKSIYQTIDSKVYNIQKKSNIKEYKEYTYKANFHDISHLMKRETSGEGTLDNSQAAFATLLRQYEPITRNVGAKKTKTT